MSTPERDAKYEQVVTQLRQLANIFPIVGAEVERVVPQIEELKGIGPSTSANIDEGRQRKEIAAQKILIEISAKLPAGDDQTVSYSREIAWMMDQIML